MIPFHYSTLIIPLFFIAQFNPINSLTTTIMPPLKRNFSSHLSLSNNSSMADASPNYKKLRRLPHVFSKVLELPFKSDVDVNIQEHPDCFEFIADLDHDLDHGVRAHVFELHPGIIKVVVGVRRENMGLPTIDELHLDVWRFRLPSSTRPELATAIYAHGQLIVTVPKNGWGEDIRRGDGSESSNCKGGFKGNMGNIILVQ